MSVLEPTEVGTDAESFNGRARARQEWEWESEWQIGPAYPFVVFQPQIKTSLDNPYFLRWLSASS